MTEPMTRLMAAAYLHLDNVPDPLRLDQAARLLGGDDPKARARWSRVLRAAADRGELPTQTITPEPREQIVTRRVPEAWRRHLGRATYTTKEPVQPPPYRVAALSHLRTFLELHREPVPAWLADVPAAPKPEPAPHTAATLGALGGKATSRRWKEQKEIALDVARQLADVPDLKMKDYISAIANKLKKEDIDPIPDDGVLRRWLNQWMKDGVLQLPSEVSRPGRPRL